MHGLPGLAALNGLLIQVEPVLLRVGPLTVRWFGLVLIAALLAGLWLTIRRAEPSGLAAGEVLDLASWVLPLGFLGARLFHLAETWEYYVTRPSEVFDLG